MDALRASASALSASFMRAVHTRCDRPRIVEDPYGDVTVTVPTHIARAGVIPGAVRAAEES